MASPLTRRLFVAALCLLLLVAATSASALQTCSVADDPLTTTPPDFTEASFMQCVANRCLTTLNINITSATDGYCNGDATTEAAVPCTTLLPAYQIFYACVLGTTVQTSEGDVTLIAALERFQYTPGYPLHMTDVPCYMCNNFRTTVAPALGASFTCAWNCEDVEPLGISLIRSDEVGKGYNHVLCGIGCMTCLLMGMAFTLISMFIFFCCGCCWPTPSLRTTAAAAVEEEAEAKEEEKDSDDDDDDEENNNNAAPEEENAAAMEEEAAPAAQARDINNSHGEDDDDEEL